MPPVKHSPVGASKAHQWLECPPSIKAEEKYGEPDTQSEAAAEGTLAHALAEDHLKKLLAGKRATTPKKIKDDPLYKHSMEEYVGVYCDTILETLTGMKQKGDPAIYLEQQVDYSKYAPEGYGTADCVILDDGTMHVFDLKFGKGVPVSAEENAQLKLYALGCIEEFGMLYDIQDVVLHIIQPRLDSISEWMVSREVLEKWGKYIVRPAAEKALKGEGDFNPGESQCRWCRAKNRCRAYNEYLLTVCQMRFDDLDSEREPNELSDKEIAEILTKGEEIKRWVKKVSEYALDQAVSQGKVFPGFKLVEGKSNRKITDEAAVIRVLSENGFGTDKTCELKGITALEDLVGEAKFKELAGTYIEKPKGKPTLAPESDKRKPYSVFTEEKEI